MAIRPPAFIYLVFSESLEFYQYVAKEPELSGEASFTSIFSIISSKQLKKWTLTCGQFVRTFVVF
jgi:hypothetical protein